MADNGATIYGYFALKDFSGWTWHNETTNEIKTFDILKGEALYIGIDTNGERHQNHLKPSKAKLQAINTFIQTGQEGVDWYFVEEMFTAPNKDLAHPMETALIDKFIPHFNIYGKGKSNNGVRMNLADVYPDIMAEIEYKNDFADMTIDDEYNIGKGEKFNTLDQLAKVVDRSKMPMFTHKARNVVVIAAKDSGKSFPVALYKIMCMEQDDMASGLQLMKYSGEAADKGIDEIMGAINYLQEIGFNINKDRIFDPSRSRIFRLPKGKKAAKTTDVKLQSQFYKFGSFESYDRIAGFKIPNGGYPFLIHIEEPVMKDDANGVPEKEKWDSDYESIHDTVYRNYRTYKEKTERFVALKEKAIAEGNNYRNAKMPIPYKIITTMNDWAPEHIVSQRAQRYFPQAEFLDWVLGFEYSELLKLWRDKIVDIDTVVPELKEVIDEHWEQLQERVLEKHTQWKYVEYDENNAYIDTLYGRMTAFGNPTLRRNEKERMVKLNRMYRALISGDSYVLAEAFGMGNSGTSSKNKRFSFKKFQPVDTNRILIEPGRELLGFCVGWDHDANRGPVATPVTMSAVKVNIGNPYEPDWVYKDYKWLVHKQVLIDGYGRGKNGANTRMYHEMMIDVSRRLYETYVGYPERELEYGKFAIFDDDDGSYVGHIAEKIMQFGYDDADSLPNKNGKIETGGYGVAERDDLWQVGVDIKKIMVDRDNTELVEWLKSVPTIVSDTGVKKRSTKGQWGKRYKDISNSAEYAFVPWAKMIKYRDAYDDYYDDSEYEEYLESLETEDK